ncbi:ATP-binding cassette domain-containing protein [Duganella sp. FT92W]|uniref:ATP-binding cassette domain-containing protein n=1 Tax=Pseudoduganella rivuli TaxID=2666085 RepID=A0A7X2ING7_9BURK|nr:ATP-binding cassette domain-containing protein [Pseudoduganella rivuli]MRV73105.1 ATP-binding cassette domain-containing protein [Pseudoduganella rivuli]
MATAYALQAANLHKAFSPKHGGAVAHALRGVSLAVAPGALTALVGPDGAGKTTLLRMAAGLLTADHGTLHVLGIDAARDPQQIQERIGYMPQRFGLYEDLSVQENLDLYADLHGVPRDIRRERYAQLLHMTDLGRFTARPAGKLSGGMKQKLGLACTLVRSPELLLLDEPTVGVDPLSRRELWDIVRQLVDTQGLTVLVSTSYMDEAERCAHVCVLHEGVVLAAGEPEQLRAKADGLCHLATPPQGIAARTLQARLLDARAVVADAVPEGGKVRYMLQPGTPPQHAGGTLAALLAGVRTQPVPARLEDGFMLILRGMATQDGAGTADIEGATPASQGDAAAHAPIVPVIEVRDLVRRFGDFTAVASTTFDVRRGEIFGLLGPNGAGKTTTFRMLCGLLPATSGTLKVAGVNLRHARAEARRKVGYVSQKFSLYGNLTVAENMRFFGGAYGLTGARLRERTAAMLAQFQLTGHQDAPSGQLPGGFKQRLAMAVGLLHAPDILFLDEPTSGADPLARRAFWRRITALAASGVTIIVTTHFMEEAEYCDRIVIQDAGRLLALGTPRDVRAQAGNADGMEQAFIAIVEKNRENA